MNGHLSEGAEACVHLAIFVEPYLTAVLEGRKTVESRFGARRRAPYRCIQANDLILIKKSGGPVVGLTVARSVHFFTLSPDVLGELRAMFSDRLCADDAFWRSRADKRYATMIELGETVSLPPTPVDKRDRQGWVAYGRTLDEGARMPL